MRTLRPLRAPLWFQVLAVTALAACVASVSPTSDLPAGVGAHDPQPYLAFWGVFLLIVDAIWKGVQVAGRVALAILQYSVHLLWRATVLIAKFGAQLGQWTWRGLKLTWGLFKATYARVLKPAWKFIWKWVDKTERWLQRTFDPLMRWLRRVRTWVLDFYRDYVRPILDVIGIGRRVLQVLSALGVDWAKRLDLELARIEAAIERPFRLLVAKINEVINIVNRVVTADGLFQRLALVRSIERDITQITAAWHNSQSKPLTDEERKAALAGYKEKTGADIIRETQVYLSTGVGPHSSEIDEWSTQLGRQLQTR